jgi:ABC-type Fe3+ transport system permease subunit
MSDQLPPSYPESQQMSPQQPRFAGDNPYASPQKIDPYKSKATTGLVLGIIAVSGLLIPVIGAIISIPCSIIGIIFSTQGRHHAHTKRGSATVGLVLSIVALALASLIYPRDAQRDDSHEISGSTGCFTHTAPLLLASWA